MVNFGDTDLDPLDNNDNGDTRRSGRPSYPRPELNDILDPNTPIDPNIHTGVLWEGLQDRFFYTVDIDIIDEETLEVVDTITRTLTSDDNLSLTEIYSTLEASGAYDIIENGFISQDDMRIMEIIRNDLRF